MTVHSRGTLNSDHRRHDRLLVTRFAAGDSYPSEVADAESLVKSCSDCAQLAADIRLLSSRTAELTAPRRPRDFRISAEQAERLRGSWFDRLMRGLAAPGWGTALRPVAGAAFALGMLLVVVGALPLGAASPVLSDVGNSLGAAVETSQPAEAPGDAPAANSGGQPAGPGGPAEMPTTEIAMEGDNRAGDPDDFNTVYMASPGAIADGGSGQASGAADAGAVSQSNIPLAYIGLLVAVAGASVLAVLLVARRRYGDALVR